MAETALAPNIYGFHIAEGGGNQDGIGDHWAALDAAGKIITLKSVGNVGDCNFVASLARASGLPHVIVYRTADPPYELPDYNRPAFQEGKDHFDLCVSVLPDDFDKDYIWIEDINEPDEDRAVWIMEFMLGSATRAIERGYKYCGPGWSSGTPRENAWLTPAAFNYLKLCQKYPDQVAIAIHEYSYNVNDIYDGSETLQDGSIKHWKIGRFLHIIAACDVFGIDYPKIMFTEWGWELWDVPDAWLAIQHIKSTFDLLYSKYPGVVIMAAIWYLGPGFKNIANQAQKLIQPTTTWILENTGPPVTGNGNGEPPGDCIETDVTSKVIQMLRPRVLAKEQKAWIDNAMTDGLDVYGSGELHAIGTEGWAHTDIMRGVREALAAGYLESRLVVVDGHLIGTGLDQDWMAENCLALSGSTVWFTTSPIDPPPGEFRYEVWPSDYRPEHVTQHWGENPDTYARFGQPGHGGVDIRAPHGTPIRVVADGRVFRAEHDPSLSGFGIHVRVEHRNGTEQTIYGHFDRIEGGVGVGSLVEAGDILGYADNTGFSFGSHLHFARKRPGEVYVDEHGTWPFNLWDPSPLLAPLAPHLFDDVPPPPPPTQGNALFGLHASADPGDLNAAEIDLFRDSRPGVIKVLSAHSGPSIGRLSIGHPDAVFIIRAFLSMRGRDISPEQFVNDTITDTQRAIAHIGDKEKLVEIHNEPNLVDEGLGSTWRDGLEFNDWYLDVLERYRAALPGERFMYPGLSPGPSHFGVRQGHSEFLQQTTGAIAASDVLGLHAYWASEPDTAYPMSTALNLVDSYVISFPGKELWITESSNNRPETPDNKAEQYIRFWEELLKRPAVKGVTYYVASASDPQWGWGPGGTGQVWEGTDIARLVGRR